MSEPTQATSSNTAPSHTSAANGASTMPSEAAAPNAPGGGERSDRNNKRGNYDNKQRRGFGSRGAGGDRHGGRGRGGRGGNNGRGGGRGGRGGRPSARPDKRPTNSEGDDPGGEKKASMMNIPFSAEEIAAEDRRPKKKVAVLIGYAGTGYKGMQINHHEKTIEGDLFAAFVAAGAIAKRNADDPKKSSFVRCARTDKGVHAAGNVVSLKLTIEDADIVEKINEKLPEQIRVWSIQRTNNAFSCYQACDSRWYEYLLPSYTLLPPHPQSFLGKKVIEAAKEKGVYEDTVLEAWDDVKDYWEEVEKNDIQPILDSLDEDVREQVVKLMHASEHPDAKVEGHDAIKTEEGQSATQSVKRKADDDTDDASAKKVKVDDQQETVEDKDTNTAAGGEEAPVADAAPVKMDTDEMPAKEEPSDAMDIDEKPADATAAGDSTKENGDASKLKYEPTAVETALKDIKTAYIAAKRRYRVTISRVKQLQAALDLYQGTNNFHNYTIQKTFKDPSAKRLIRSFVVNPEPIQIRDTEWLSLKVHGQSFMMHQIRKMVAMAVLGVRCATPLERIRQSYGPTRISIPKAPGLGLLLERPVFESYSKKAKNDFGLEPLSFDKHEEKIKEFKHRMIYNRIWDTEEKEASFHIFLNQLDSFHADYFLWLTAHGFGAAYEPKERYDPKLKPKTFGVKEEHDLVGDDEDAEDGADGAGDEG